MTRVPSLRRLLLAGSISAGVVVLLVIGGGTALFAYIRQEFERNLQTNVVEQRTAEEIMASVYGQLLTAYRQVQTPSPENTAKFDSLGQIAYNRLRTYLDRPMDLESRLQVEEIKEKHQQLEVEARAALDLIGRSDTTNARKRVAQMELRATELEAAMIRFLALREKDRSRERDAQASKLQNTVVTLGALIVILTIAGLLFVRTVKRRVAAPLAQLSEAAIRLGDGDLTARVPPQRDAELITVANSFNEMADRMREANRAQERSEVRYRRLFNEAPIPLYRTSPNGVMLDANPALVDLLGYAAVTDVIGEQVEPWYVENADRKSFTQSIEQHGIIRNQTIELRKLTGERIWVVDTTRAVIDPETGETSYEGGLLDVTERRQMEAALRERDERFREMADHIKEAFFVVELATGKPLYISPTWAEIWGRPLSDGYDPAIWFGAIHPDDRSIMVAAQLKVKSGIADESVFRIVRPDESVRWVRGRAFPVRDASGDVHRMVGVSEDITELRQTEERLTQAQKMDAVGRLAGGVAHDFNNLLTVIIAETDMIQNGLPVGTVHREGLAEIRRASESAVALTQQLLAFSRKQLVEPVVFNLNESVAETGTMLRRLIGENVKLELRLGADAMVRADRGQIQQVLTNLAVNARDAMPTGGVLSIETSIIVVTERDLDGQHDLAVGEFVLWSVSDTGTGMSEDVRARAFEPFFTTKELGKGTGLGLATSHGIVKQAGGFIGMHSELNVGTTVRIYLPRVHSKGTPTQPTTTVTDAPKGTETILMVEDEPAVRRIGARILRRQGYTVLEAGDADEALRILSDHSGLLHMLFTDVVLPGIGGRELSDRVKLARPGIRVLFTSGYTDDVILQHKLAAQDVMIVHKPYSWVVLAQKVRAALDAT